MHNILTLCHWPPKGSPYGIAFDAKTSGWAFWQTIQLEFFCPHETSLWWSFQWPIQSFVSPISTLRSTIYSAQAVMNTGTSHAVLGKQNLNIFWSTVSITIWKSTWCRLFKVNFLSITSRWFFASGRLHYGNADSKQVDLRSCTFQLYKHHFSLYEWGGIPL